MPDPSRLPSVQDILERSEAREALREHGPHALSRALKTALAETRQRLRDRGGVAPRADELLEQAAAALVAERERRLHAVVNATGVVLPADLGRAPLSADAREALSDAAGYGTVDVELEDGARSPRWRHPGQLAAEACGAESGMVVNNGAAAVLLVLAALAGAREVVVSRAELLEIGDYRVTDMIAAAGARLVETGTTNRTRSADVRASVSDATGVILSVHQAGYEVVGDVESPTVAELAEIAKAGGVHLVRVLGTGLLVPGEGTLEGEPDATTAIADGAGLVVFSGDKLLGGPQAGIVVGREDLVMRCARHPLARALRIDKLRRGALEATLESHLKNPIPVDLPVWAMLRADLDGLERRARRLAQHIGEGAKAEPSTAVIGGGARHGKSMPSWSVLVPATDVGALTAALRRERPPVIGRPADDGLVLDVRTIPPAHDTLVGDLVRRAQGRGALGPEG